MTDQHPITPPAELVQEWINEEDGLTAGHIATQAARWGADQELEACCEWLDRNNQWARCDIDELHDARRPKPPSLKAQALAALRVFGPSGGLTPDEIDALRRALEQLDD